jgi:hypothetical protein
MRDIIIVFKFLFPFINLESTLKLLVLTQFTLILMIFILTILLWDIPPPPVQFFYLQQFIQLFY